MTLRTWTYLLGYQVSGALYPSVKDEVERVHLWEHEGMPHTQETCPLVLRIVDEIREHHVTNFVDDRLDYSEQAMTARGKLHHTFPWDRCDYMCTCRDAHKYVYMCNLLYVQNHSIFTFCVVIIIYFPKG